MRIATVGGSGTAATGGISGSGRSGNPGGSYGMTFGVKVDSDKATGSMEGGIE